MFETSRNFLVAIWGKLKKTWHISRNRIALKSQQVYTCNESCNKSATKIACVNGPLHIRFLVRFLFHFSKLFRFPTTLLPLLWRLALNGPEHIRAPQQIFMLQKEDVMCASCNIKSVAHGGSNTCNITPATLVLQRSLQRNVARNTQIENKTVHQSALWAIENKSDSSRFLPLILKPRTNINNYKMKMWPTATNLFQLQLIFFRTTLQFQLHVRDSRPWPLRSRCSAKKLSYEDPYMESRTIA